jgi:hypothetical protein
MARYCEQGNRPSESKKAGNLLNTSASISYWKIVLEGFRFFFWSVLYFISSSLQPSVSVMGTHSYFKKLR